MPMYFSYDNKFIVYHILLTLHSYNKHIFHAQIVCRLQRYDKRKQTVHFIAEQFLLRFAFHISHIKSFDTGNWIVQKNVAKNSIDYWYIISMNRTMIYNTPKYIISTDQKYREKHRRLRTRRKHKPYSDNPRRRMRFNPSKTIDAKLSAIPRTVPTMPRINNVWRIATARWSAASSDLGVKGDWGRPVYDVATNPTAVTATAEREISRWSNKSTTRRKESR